MKASVPAALPVSIVRELVTTKEWLWPAQEILLEERR